MALFLMGAIDKMYSSSSSERPLERVIRSWVQLISEVDLCSYLILVSKNMYLVHESVGGWQKNTSDNLQPQFNEVMK